MVNNIVHCMMRMMVTMMMGTMVMGAWRGAVRAVGCFHELR